MFTSSTFKLDVYIDKLTVLNVLEFSEFHIPSYELDVDINIIQKLETGH